MNYDDDHNFIESTQQTMLRVALVALVVSSQSSSSCRASRAVLFDKLDTNKMHGLDTSIVSSRNVTSQVEFGLYTAVFKWAVQSENGLIIGHFYINTFFVGIVGLFQVERPLMGA